MLSLIGSIQPDPFSPEHISEALESMIASPGKQRAQQVAHHLEDDESDSEADGEEVEDDEHAEEERARQEAAAKAAKSEKKRQRKERAEKTGAKKTRTS